VVDHTFLKLIKLECGQVTYPFLQAEGKPFM